MSNESQPIEVVCRYRLKPGKEQEFERILAVHWRLLSDQGLTTEQPAEVLRAADSAGNVAYLESFSWRDQGAVTAAHESPEVMKLWEPMGALCEDMEFWNVEPVQL